MTMYVNYDIERVLTK